MASLMKALFTAKGAAVAGLGALAVYGIKKWSSGPACAYNASNTNLSGKTVVITGANAGIGRETALALAGMGAHVVLAGRDEKRNLQVVDEIKHSGKGKAEFMALDLSDLDSVRAFSANYHQKHTRCHILINNAGVMGTGPEAKTKQGHEMQFGTNHLGHFLLTNLMLDVLKASAPSRVVTVASRAHRRAQLDLNDVDWTKRKWSFGGTYGASKLANMLFAEELARRLEGTGVTTTSLHPGVVNTELARTFGSAASVLKVVLYPVIWLLLKDVTQGAQTTLHCALAPQLVNGAYYADCALKKTENAMAGDKAVAAGLWQLSEQLVGLKK